MIRLPFVPITSSSRLIITCGMVNRYFRCRGNNESVLESICGITRHLMSIPSLSRSAFAAPGQPSLADLAARIQGDPALPQSTRQNWAWALRALCRAARAEPEFVAAHPEAIRRLCGKAAPAA